MKLLVVEDDAQCVEFIRMALGSLCRQFDQTNRLTEALRMIAPDYDAIWLDLVLEDSNALESIASIPYIRKVAPATTIIVVSGYGDTYRKMAMDAGADAYASKIDLHGFNKASIAALVAQAAVHAMNRGVDVNRILQRVSAFFTHLVRSEDSVTHA